MTSAGGYGVSTKILGPERGMQRVTRILSCSSRSKRNGLEMRSDHLHSEVLFVECGVVDVALKAAERKLLIENETSLACLGFDRETCNLCWRRVSLEKTNLYTIPQMNSGVPSTGKPGRSTPTQTRR